MQYYCISTRHDTHADLIVKGLSAGKNVFVEKPLCINYSDLEKLNLLTINQTLNLR